MNTRGHEFAQIVDLPQIQEWPRIPIEPDPRIGTDRPDWLTSDEWRNHLTALSLDDCRWLANQWDLATA